MTTFDCNASPSTVRAAIQSGQYTGYTAGICRGYVQANICILPKSWADDFLLYCQRNQAACPLLAVGDPGQPLLPRLGQDIDIRNAVPRYQVFMDGQLTDQVTDIHQYWRDDLVTFALGCSFSFEEALQEAGIPLPFLDAGNVAGVYETNIDTAPAGKFRGKLVVTMRPFSPAHAIRAIQITTRFPNVHGAPVHIGDPGQIGIDLQRRYQDIGSAHIPDGQLPLFWACGLTPQLAVANARPPLCITHAPSSMLITDIRNAALAAL